MLPAKSAPFHPAVYRPVTANINATAPVTFPYAGQAQQLVDGNSTFTPALHTLFLQRWRLSLVIQTTTLNHQLLEEEREQLLSEVQERMTLSGQLDPVLAETTPPQAVYGT